MTESVTPLCCCSVAQSCPTLCHPMDRSTPDFPVLHYLPQFAQIHVHWVNDVIQPSHPLSLPSFDRNLSQHQGLFISGGNWSFNFSISPSNEYSGLISFRIPWFDLLAVQRTLKSLLQHHSLKASILRHSASFKVQFSYLYMTTGKTIALTIWESLSAKWCLCFLIRCLGCS